MRSFFAGAPFRRSFPRVVSLMTRSPLGIAWVEYWNKLLYQGVLPHKLVSDPTQNTSGSLRRLKYHGPFLCQ
jgi:hypothetical protein